MPVIDIHTHVFGNAWLDMLIKHGAPDYGSERMPDGRDYLMERGAPACAFEKEHFDYDLFVKAMDRHGIDLAIVSVTSPSVQWGGEEISARTAIAANDEMAAGQTAYPDRLRWFASLPWEFPDKALAELKRAIDNGAVGVFATANINGRNMIEPLFVPIWAELDRLRIPVLIHPTVPLGGKDANFGLERILLPAAGFMFDTTLAIARMVIDGFFDRFTNLNLIVSHTGGYLPYVAGRIDVFARVETLAEIKCKDKPSDYLKRLHYDAINYDQGGLELCVNLAGPEKVMFGTDFPMPADVAKLKELAGTFPADQRDGILGGNAQKMFNL